MSGTDHHIRLALSRPQFGLQVDVQLPARGITAVLGHSGSGKTTLLRAVAGLEMAARGLVRMAGEVWQDDATGVSLPTWRRPLGYVFQEASLLDHLDVLGNLQFGLSRLGRRQPRVALDEAIALLGIGHLLDRPTHQLSGGERQRVAIARALATSPSLLLLDEPMAALDLARRQEILPWLEKLRDELKLPMLYVTHSADEAARLADHLVVLDKGQVIAQGTTRDLLSALDMPVMLGDDVGSVLLGRITHIDAHWHLACVAFTGGQLWLRDTGLAVGREVRLRILARDVSLATEQPRHTSVQNLLPCVVDALTPDAHPSQMLVRLVCQGTPVLARVTARAVHDLALQPGLPVWAQVKAVALLG